MISVYKNNAKVNYELAFKSYHNSVSRDISFKHVMVITTLHNAYYFVQLYQMHNAFYSFFYFQVVFQSVL